MADSFLFNLLGVISLLSAVIIYYFQNEPTPQSSNRLSEIHPLSSFDYWKELNLSHPVIRKEKIEELRALIVFLRYERFSFQYRAYKKALKFEQSLLRFERNLKIEVSWIDEGNCYRMRKDELVKEFQHNGTNKKRLYFPTDYITELSKDAARLQSEYKELQKLLNRRFVFSLKY